MPIGWEAAEQAMLEAFPKAGAEIRAWFEFIESLAKAVMVMLGMAQPETGSMQLLLEWGMKTLQDALDHFFKGHEAAKLAASGTWSWLGQGPDIQGLGYFALAYYNYIKEGAWQLHEGSQSLAKAYETKLKDAGAEIRLKTPVEKIHVKQNQAHLCTGQCGSQTTQPASHHHNIVNLTHTTHLKPEVHLDSQIMFG